jgi:FixJ family two-component response regulator
MSKRGKVVAVVDDDPAMLKAIARLLKIHGFTVEVFDSAEAFLRRDAASEAACLVLDIQLTGISGLELRRRMRASGDKLPIIFITAVDDEAVHKEAMEAGCVAYLRKPFPATKLIGAINQATG